jgi:hypothetical protein
MVRPLVSDELWELIEPLIPKVQRQAVRGRAAGTTRPSKRPSDHLPSRPHSSKLVQFAALTKPILALVFAPSVRRISVSFAIAVALAVPASASARVRLVHVTSPISAGSYATLTAAVSPSRSCSITVYYKSGPSHAQGLYPKRPSGGRVSWTWKVGTRTTPGRWPITVSCGSAGRLRTSFVVV